MGKGGFSQEKLYSLDHILGKVNLGRYVSILPMSAFIKMYVLDIVKNFKFSPCLWGAGKAAW